MWFRAHIYVSGSISICGHVPRDKLAQVYIWQPVLDTGNTIAQFLALVAEYGGLDNNEPVDIYGPTPTTEPRRVGRYGRYSGDRLVTVYMRLDRERFDNHLY